MQCLELPKTLHILLIFQTTIIILQTFEWVTTSEKLPERIPMQCCVCVWVVRYCRLYIEAGPNKTARLKGNEYTFQGGNSVKLFLSPFWKGIYSKRKEFAPSGSKFFSFREGPFTEGACSARDKKLSSFAIMADIPLRVSNILNKNRP